MLPTLHGVVDPNGSVVGIGTPQFYINTVNSTLWYWDSSTVSWWKLV